MSIYRVERVEVHRSELRTILLDRLRGNVFHVTTQDAWPRIRSTDSVLSNPPDHPSIKRWEYNAYFRQKSHVSLCDLRSVQESDLNMALKRYFFLDPRSGCPEPVFLILSSSAVNRIVTYNEAIDDATKAGQMIVPFVEAGYPGDLPLAEITDVLIVDIDRPRARRVRSFGCCSIAVAQRTPMPPGGGADRCSARPDRVSLAVPTITGGRSVLLASSIQWMDSTECPNAHGPASRPSPFSISASPCGRSQPPEAPRRRWTGPAQIGLLDGGPSLRPGCRLRRGSVSRPDLVRGSSARSGSGRQPRSRPGCRAGERGSPGHSRRLPRWRVFPRHK